MSWWINLLMPNSILPFSTIKEKDNEKANTNKKITNGFEKE